MEVTQVRNGTVAAFDIVAFEASVFADGFQVGDESMEC
jgi:hypothetical protein